jgi:2-hydroxychromene-2-carboxylate isomerase
MTNGVSLQINNKEQTKGNAMIEFFFDCSSPWTYLAFHNIQPLAKEFGAEISTIPPIEEGGSCPNGRACGA